MIEAQCVNPDCPKRGRIFGSASPDLVKTCMECGSTMQAVPRPTCSTCGRPHLLADEKDPMAELRAQNAALKARVEALEVMVEAGMVTGKSSRR